MDYYVTRDSLWDFCNIENFVSSIGGSRYGFFILSVETTLEAKYNDTFCAVFGSCLFGGDVFVRKIVRGSVTVEAVVIVPLIVFIFVVLVNIFFYYHDKNILLSVVCCKRKYARSGFRIVFFL